MECWLWSLFRLFPVKPFLPTKLYIINLITKYIILNIGFPVFDGMKLTIKALRNIEKDEELTISYTSNLNTIADRTDYLYHIYRFKCDCNGCHDEQAIEINNLMLKGENGKIMETDFKSTN